MAWNRRVKGAEARILNAAQWIDLVFAEWERELDAFVQAQIQKRRRLEALLLRLQTLSVTSEDPLDVAGKEAAFDAVYKQIRRETATAIRELNRRYRDEAMPGFVRPSMN